MHGRNIECLDILDSRIKNAPYCQSLTPFGKRSTFPDGISAYFCVSGKKASAEYLQNAIMSSGGLEAQRTPELLFWLMMSIGTCGSIIPNTLDRRCQCNPSQVVLGAMASCLEMCWLLRSESISLDQLPVLQLKNNACSTRISVLWNLKGRLSGVTKVMACIKNHLSSHMMYQWAWDGSPSVNDTDACEADHKKDKINYQATSKRFSTFLKELNQLVSYTYKVLCYRKFNLNLLMLQ